MFWREERKRHAEYVGKERGDVGDRRRGDADVVEATEFHDEITFNPTVRAIRNTNALPITPNQKSAGSFDLLQRPKNTEL